MQIRGMQLNGELFKRREACLQENDALLLKFKQSFIF
jgi:hypothetical protein